jgi:hypothetical protein
MILANRITAFFITILVSLSSAAIAAELTIPEIFSKGAPASADQVNANFNAVKEAVDDNDARINALSEPRSASVTYSAMGFVPEDNTIQFSKNRADGALSISVGEDEGRFFHCLTIRPGVTITRIRAYPNDITANLYQQGISEALATSNNSEDISITIEPFPASYFIGITLTNSEHNFYSVNIDYTYTEPVPQP